MVSCQLRRLLKAGRSSLGTDAECDALSLVRKLSLQYICLHAAPVTADIPFRITWTPVLEEHWIPSAFEPRARGCEPRHRYPTCSLMRRRAMHAHSERKLTRLCALRRPSPPPDGTHTDWNRHKLAHTTLAPSSVSDSNRTDHYSPNKPFQRLMTKSWAALEL